MAHCKKGYKVEILKSGAGFYLGTRTEDGMPNCRLSTMYMNDIGDCIWLKPDREYNCMENEFCNGGCGCGICQDEI